MVDELSLLARGTAKNSQQISRSMGLLSFHRSRPTMRAMASDPGTVQFFPEKLKAMLAKKAVPKKKASKK